MMFYSDEFASAYAEQRQQQLQDEAETYRLMRHVRARQPRHSDQMLAAAGALLVRWGTHLQQRSRPPATHLSESRPV